MTERANDIVSGIREEFNSQIARMMEHTANLMKGLPTPIVNVEPSIINVPQQELQVLVPPDSIRVTAEAPPPRKTITTKSIEYAPDGRPSTITEILQEEDQ